MKIKLSEIFKLPSKRADNFVSAQYGVFSPGANKPDALEIFNKDKSYAWNLLLAELEKIELDACDVIDIITNKAMSDVKRDFKLDN